MPKENLKDALQKLEKIVNDLNNKDVDVEVGLSKFKEGVTLIKFCREQLKKAENEFKKLKSELDVEEDEEIPEVEDDDPEEREVSLKDVPF